MSEPYEMVVYPVVIYQNTTYWVSKTVIFMGNCQIAKVYPKKEDMHSNNSFTVGYHACHGETME